MNVKNNCAVLAVLSDRELLRKRAFAILRDICADNNGDVEIESDITMDFDTELFGTEMCNIERLFITLEGKLYATISTCNSGIEDDVEITGQDALEVLQIILADAGDLECNL